MNDLDVANGSANVYADLGFPDAEEMLVKAQLARKIEKIIGDRGLTHLAASRLVNLPEPQLSGLMRGQFRGISQEKLLRCLMLLGNDITLAISESMQAQGEMRVIDGQKATTA